MAIVGDGHLGDGHLVDCHLVMGTKGGEQE
jgi:hypothetical protein